jgi:phosphatidylinositol alpha-1,6-mannosyltransferase
MTTDFKPMVGGVAEYLHNLWEHMARLRPVSVMTLVQPSVSDWEHSYRLEILPPPPQRKLGRLPGDGIPPVRKLNTANHFYRLDCYAARTVKAVRERVGDNFKAVIGIWDTESHFLCRQLRRAGVPYYIHAYGLEVVSTFYGNLPRWRREDFLKAEGVLACSHGTAALVRSCFGESVAVRAVNPGVIEPTDCEAVTARAALLKRELDLAGKSVILTVGRLVPRKGIDLVLRSLAELASGLPRMHYLIVGDGPEKNSLRRLAGQLGVADRVTFLGAVDEVTKWAAYELCDLFVLPNRTMGGTDWEGFGIVFLEAALAGKPSVGGDNGGVPDAIEDGVTGLLVDPEARECLSSSIARMIGDDGLRSRMGQAAEARAKSRFNWKAIASDLCASGIRPRRQGSKEPFCDF